MTKSWIDQVERRVSRWVSRGLGGSWLVAVSGGGDSVGLLRVLHSLAARTDLSLSVAHLDHGVRGEASRADAEFVAELARSLGLPFDLGQWRPTRAKHFEADARRARYAWLTEIARSRQATTVAVGHNRDDQAETILHRIVRGTAPSGLAGIPSTRRLATDPRVTLVRPLLAASRDEIRHYLADLGQSFREDQSNTDLTRTRARIRHDLLPKLASEYNPKVAEALVRLGSLTASFLTAIEADLRKLVRASVITNTPATVVLKHPYLNSIPSFLRAEVLRRVWRSAGWPEAGMSAKRWRRLAALAQNRDIAPVEIGEHVTISTDRFFLVLRRSPPSVTASSGPSGEKPIVLESPGLVLVPWASCRIEARMDLPPNVPDTELIDFDQVHFPLHVRAPAPADRFEPLGMGGSTTPLADFFRGRHIPRNQRARTPLICDQLGIIWVAGHRIADRVKRTEQTRRTVGLRLAEVRRQELE
jgi:tRNA(Ile)-lysidine synthase